MDIGSLPKTRKDAQAVGASYYFTGIPCKHGHVAPRKTKGACIECLKNEWIKNNELRSNYFKDYNKKEETVERKHQWYIDNREKVILAASITPKHIKKEYQQKWKANNLTWVRADTKARRRKHRQATPIWLSKAHKKEIREIYKQAITLTKLTGEQYVVDHVYPLRSNFVCGLHVPWNLRVITQEENLRKSNQLPSGQKGP
jgi:hypothetical protein